MMVEVSKPVPTCWEGCDIPEHTHIGQKDVCVYVCVCVCVREREREIYQSIHTLAKLYGEGSVPERGVWICMRMFWLPQ